METATCVHMLCRIKLRTIVNQKHPVNAPMVQHAEVASVCLSLDTIQPMLTTKARPRQQCEGGAFALTTLTGHHFVGGQSSDVVSWMLQRAVSCWWYCLASLHHVGVGGSFWTLLLGHIDMVFWGSTVNVAGGAE